MSSALARSPLPRFDGFGESKFIVSIFVRPVLQNVTSARFPALVVLALNLRRSCCASVTILRATHMAQLPTEGMGTVSRKDLELALRNEVPETPTVVVLLQENTRYSKIDTLGTMPLGLIEAVYPRIQIFKHDGYDSVQYSNCQSFAMNLVLLWLHRTSREDELIPFETYLPEADEKRAYYYSLQTILAADALGIPHEIAREPGRKIMEQFENDEAKWGEVVDALFPPFSPHSYTVHQQRFARVVASTMYKHTIKDKDSLRELQIKNMAFRHDVDIAVQECYGW